MATAVQEVEWITLGHAARLLGVSRDTVSELAQDGRLTRREIPKAWVKVPLHEVEALAEKCTTPAQEVTE